MSVCARLGFKRDTLVPKNDLHLEKSRTNVQGKEFLISPNLCLILKKRRVIQTKMSHFTTKMLKISILACFLRFERKEICFNLQNVQLSRVRNLWAKFMALWTSWTDKLELAVDVSGPL